MIGSVLVVDDDKDLLTAVAEWLTIQKYENRTANSADEAKTILERWTPDVVLSDIRMPGTDGIELLKYISDKYHEIPVILITGHGDIPIAVEAIQIGAYDFIEKPYNPDHLASVLARAVEKRNMARELCRLRTLVSQKNDMSEKLIGTSKGIIELRAQITSLASIDVDVLIRGDTGTGKELVARALHEYGDRSSGNFIAINAAAIPETVFESEIFGYAKGAFTGAGENKPGKLEFAKGGTVFLDEIESMPLSLQAKMLRVIQERVVDRLGDNVSRPIDVRFIAAVKGDLKIHSDEGRFRKDLYYRLSTAELRIPQLKERGEDIELLFRVFLDEAAVRYNKPPAQIPLSVLRYLKEHDWPGNVRELKSYADKYVLGLVYQPSDTHGTSHPESANNLSLSDLVANYEAEEIKKVLDETSGNTAEAAKILQTPRRTLNEKILKYGLRNR